MTKDEEARIQANGVSEEAKEMGSESDVPPRTARKRVVVVGLGMVGIAFVEKLMKLDAKRQEYEVIIIGEESHLAYNRVGKTYQEQRVLYGRVSNDSNYHRPHKLLPTP